MANPYYALPLDIPNYLQYNFVTMNMANNEAQFTTTPTAFSVVAATYVVPDNPPGTMTPAAFQSVVHTAADVVYPAAVTEPDTIPSGAGVISYYWSHGYVPNSDHTSASCRALWY